MRISAIGTRENVIVRVEITNRGRLPYRLLEWDLPAEGQMIKPLFRVHREKHEIRFRPKVVIDQEIGKDDYLTIEPGRTCTATIGLIPGYDVAPNGGYRIQYQALNQVVGDGSGMEFDEWLKSNVIVVRRR